MNKLGVVRKGVTPDLETEPEATEDELQVSAITPLVEKVAQRLNNNEDEHDS